MPPNQRLHARWNAVGSEYPSRYVTSEIEHTGKQGVEIVAQSLKSLEHAPELSDLVRITAGCRGLSRLVALSHSIVASRHCPRKIVPSKMAHAQKQVTVRTRHPHAVTYK